MKHRFLYPIILLLLSFFLAQIVSAQDADERIKRLEVMIEQLQESLAEVKAEMAKSQSSDKMAKGLVRTNGKEDIVVSTTGGGFKVKSDNGNSFQFSGRLLYDLDSFDDLYAGNGATQSEGEWRRTRLTAKGSVGEDWHYKFTVNIDDGDESSDVNTAYIKYTGFNPMAITFGKFKEPFGLERLTSSKWTSTIERSLITDALGGPLGAGEPDTAGIMFSGYHKEMNHFKWAIGAFDDGTEDGDGDDSYAVTGRLAMTPMWDKNHFMHLGVAYSLRDLEDKAYGREDRLGVHTAGKTEYIKEIQNAEDADQFGLEAAYVRGPFSLQGEYVDLQIDGDQGDGSSADTDGEMWYIQATYTLTGETRGYNLVSGAFNKIKPYNKYGAWELVARYEDAEFDGDHDDDENEIDKYVLGVNWYVNNNIRFSANYIDTEVDGVYGPDEDDDGDAFSLRAQYVW